MLLRREKSYKKGEPSLLFAAAHAWDSPLLCHNMHSLRMFPTPLLDSALSKSSAQFLAFFSKFLGIPTYLPGR